MVRTKLLCIFVFFIFHSLIFAQKEGNIWYFGENAGLDFNAGAPVPLLDGQLDNLEGCASISDNNGNLLFYTDGMTVWNKIHQVMQNGNGLSGFPSSAQSGIIVKKPGSLNMYYVCTIAYMYNPTVGLSYSEVDMDLDNGNGAVTSSKNILLLTPTCERIVAVTHENNVDYWLITKKFDTDQFNVFLIDNNGINTTPVVSNHGSIMNSWGFVVASPDCCKIGTSDRFDGYEVFDFDNTTGIISNPIQLGHGNESYGICFSPNSKVLYACNINSGEIYQWNLKAGTSLDIINSWNILGIANGGGTSYKGGALQIGPDGKIYICQYLITSLAVINDPNIIGSACDFQIDAIDLANRQSQLGLPNFVYPYNFPRFKYHNLCFNDTTFFTITSDTNAIDSVLWIFDDLASGLNNYSIVYNPSHQFSNPGSYNIKLIRYYKWNIDTVNEWITIGSNYYDTHQVSICNGDSIFAGGQFQYIAGTYYDSLTTVIGCDSITETILSVSDTYNIQTNISICVGDSIFLNGQYQTTSGIYIDSLFAVNNCDTIISTSLTVNPIPYIDLGNDTSLCEGDFMLLNAVTTNASYIWQDNSTDSVLLVDHQGNFWVEVTLNGCSNTDSIAIVYMPISIVSLGQDTTICNGEYLLLDVSRPNATYLWQDNSTEPTMLISKNGEYWVVVTEDKCSASDTIKILVEECNVILEMPNVFSPNSDGFNERFIPIKMENVVQADLIIYNRWGKKIFEGNNLSEGWDGRYNGSQCAEGVYFWIVKYKDINNMDYQKSGSVTVLR